MWKSLRKYGRILNAFYGFLYDFKRFYFYSAWKSDVLDKEIRNYHMVKVYHSLEKSLSFKSRKKNAGWSTAKLVLDLVRVADSTGDYGYHDRAGLAVLKNFVNHSDNKDDENAKKIKKEIEGLGWSISEEHGVKSYGAKDFLLGKLNDPEAFFLSRYSLREFKSEQVDISVVERAILLAMKTPSVCNRQAWHVYHSNKSDVVKKALSYQQGNRGFGEKVPNLLIITSDLKAFMPGQEHYQHWIDGGLFSMSLIYAFHSLGVASCCLNWSQSPKNDMKLRSAFNIRSSDTVIMMLAFGYPEKNNVVCESARKPAKEIYSKLEIKNNRINK